MPFNLRSLNFSTLAFAVMLSACSTQPQSVINTEFMGANLERARYARAPSRPNASERRSLSETDRRDVDVAGTTGSTPSYSITAARNFRLCLRRSMDCRPEELRDDERRLVEHAAKAKNYSSCLSGNSSCQQQGLDAEQQEKAELARYNRNLAGCISGSSECRRGDSSSADSKRVFATK